MHVPATDPRRSVDALAQALGAPASGAWSLIVVFAAFQLDPDEVARALAARFPGIPLIGCTSCGELGAGGDHERTVAAIAIASPRLRVGIGCANDLARSALRSSRAAVAEAAGALHHTPESLQPGRHVGIALVDGRSGFEESFCLGSAATAPQLRFVGGSASDGFGAIAGARVFCGGKALAGAGVVAIIETDLPFAVIESEHMVPTDARVVVTGAEPERRRVLELDGQPAAKRYAALLAAQGATSVDAITAARFPFALYIGGRPYVRSVAEFDGDALQMASAVDPGAVLRLMRAGDLVGSTRQALSNAAIEVGGDLRAVIAFSCFGRHREAVGGGLRGELGAIYDASPLIGFHSFGEQKGPLLVNHTLTGLALGAARA